MKLKEIRERNGMTTRELGKQLGVGGTAITNWETGLRRPNIDMLIRLTEIFGCTADELLGISRAGQERKEESTE